MFTSSTAEKEPILNRKERARAHLEESGRQAKAALDTTADGLDTAAHAIGRDVRDFVESAVHTTNDGLLQAKEKIVKAKNKVSSAADTMTDYIREKPVSSAAIALVVGACLGAFFRRH